jgi:hypothetical protein
MSKRSARIKEDLRALVPPTIYFFIALHIIVWIRDLLMHGTGIALGTSVSVAALILAKAVSIADLLPFIDRFPADVSSFAQ